MRTTVLISTQVKAKQKYNELMAGVDQYGEVYKDRCNVM